MGYEIAGAWGAAFGRPTGQVYSMVGDGSYLMMNSEIYASVLSGKKFILVVCDNEGYAVIERLQVGQGGASYNNMLKDSTGHGRRTCASTSRAHARSMGALTLEVGSLAEFAEALQTARAADRTTVIVTQVRAERLDRGRRVLAGRRAGGQRAAAGRRGAGADGRGPEGTAPRRLMTCR